VKARVVGRGVSVPRFACTKVSDSIKAVVAHALLLLVLPLSPPLSPLSGSHRSFASRCSRVVPKRKLKRPPVRSFPAITLAVGSRYEVYYCTFQCRVELSVFVKWHRANNCQSTGRGSAIIRVPPHQVSRRNRRPPPAAETNLIFWGGRLFEPWIRRN
jgi:hypothetical protein